MCWIESACAGPAVKPQSASARRRRAARRAHSTAGCCAPLLATPAAPRARETCLPAGPDLRVSGPCQLTVKEDTAGVYTVRTLELCPAPSVLPSLPCPTVPIAHSSVRNNKSPTSLKTSIAAVPIAAKPSCSVFFCSRTFSYKHHCCLLNALAKNQICPGFPKFTLLTRFILCS